LSPEMRSTGEVMGLDTDLGVAYAKAQMAANSPLPLSGKVFISIADAHKKDLVEVAQSYLALGFQLVATDGTAARLEAAGLKVERTLKVLQGRPNIVDLLKNKEIQLVINTPSGAAPREDEVRIRTTAVITGTPIMTTISGAKAAALGIAALQRQGYSVERRRRPEGAAVLWRGLRGRRALSPGRSREWAVGPSRAPIAERILDPSGRGVAGRSLSVHGPTDAAAGVAVSLCRRGGSDRRTVCRRRDGGAAAPSDALPRPPLLPVPGSRRP
ncbi:MAG: hypothetical protein EBU81_00695, partial [Proteobacteria bacterium]|nr:hypothetical protein [Pseudomonadota bacterium]